MSLWKIAWRSIQQRKLSSLLTGLSIALGVALVVIVLVVHGVVAESFSEAAQGYHLILGAKGEIAVDTQYGVPPQPADRKHTLFLLQGIHRNPGRVGKPGTGQVCIRSRSRSSLLSGGQLQGFSSCGNDARFV